VARRRCARVISFVQVAFTNFGGGRWVTIGVGTAGAASLYATGALENTFSPDGEGERPFDVRVMRESELSREDLIDAYADIQRQAVGR